VPSFRSLVAASAPRLGLSLACVATGACFSPCAALMFDTYVDLENLIRTGEQVAAKSSSWAATPACGGTGSGMSRRGNNVAERLGKPRQYYISTLAPSRDADDYASEGRETPRFVSTYGRSAACLHLGPSVHLPVCLTTLGFCDGLSSSLQLTRACTRRTYHNAASRMQLHVIHWYIASACSSTRAKSAARRSSCRTQRKPIPYAVP